MSNEREEACANSVAFEVLVNVMAHDTVKFITGFTSRTNLPPNAYRLNS